MAKDTKKLDFNIENFNLTYSEVNDLINEIELIKRRKIVDKDIITYIDPLGHVAKLQRAVNHIIVGRRGSGKTSLLIKIREELEKKGNLLLFVDIQKLRNQSAADILNYILRELMIAVTDDIANISNWRPLEERYVKKSIFRRLFRGTPELASAIKNQDDLDKIFILASHIHDQLKTILEIDEGALVQKVKKDSNERAKSLKFNLRNDTELKLKVAKLVENRTSFKIVYSSESKSETQDEIITKSEKLFSKDEAIRELQNDLIELVKQFYEKRNKAIYIFLDDFYQIKLPSQPFIYNYLHEISKETTSGAFAFNTCVVPNRFKLNFDNEKILSHRDDFGTIILDREFDDLEANKDMLLQILCSIKPDFGLDKRHIAKLFNDTNVLNKIIFASGVLPRVFLDVFELMVRHSLAENKTKIHNDVFHEAIKELSRGKDELVVEEADFHQDVIRRLKSILEEEVKNGCKTNLVLYPIELFESHERILTTLFNLGYIHRIKEEEKVGEKRYVPIMLDMTFTHGSKSFPKGFKMVNFWDRKKYNREKCTIWHFDNNIVSELLMNQD